jgi:hypothetical protein
VPTTTSALSPPLVRPSAPPCTQLVRDHLSHVTTQLTFWQGTLLIAGAVRWTAPPPTEL